MLQPTTTIEIRLVGQNIKVDPDTAEANPNDPVEWSCEHPFVVQFKAQSPTDQVTHKKKSKTRGQAYGTIRGGATPGLYAYMVAVAKEVDGEIEVYVQGSPDIKIPRTSAD